MNQNHQRLVAKLKNYQPSDYAKDLVQTTPILLLVGISGAGKDTIKHKLLTDNGGDYHHIVSHTTRQPRANKGVMERDGVDYHFIDWETAEKMVDQQSFIEAKIYTTNLYGTSVSELEAAKRENRIAMTDLEVQGVGEYKQISPNVKAIFLLPPSYQAWQQRYRSRYGGGFDQASDDISRRMQTALDELDFALTSGFFEFVVNDDLSAAVTKVDDIAHGRVNEDQQKYHDLVRSLMSELKNEIA